MDGFVCGASLLLLPEDIPDATSDQDPCCAGRAIEGPRGCECWAEVFDLEQAPVTEGLPLPAIPLRPCEPGPGDDGCAYRAASPEKTGNGNADAAELDRIAATGSPFYCHNGIRRVTHLRHPAGLTYKLPGNSDYRPPIRGRVPYRADGRPAYVCAGWLLRRAVLVRQQQEVRTP